MTASCRLPDFLTMTATRLPSGAGAGVSISGPSTSLSFSIGSADLKRHSQSPVPWDDRKFNDDGMAWRA